MRATIFIFSLATVYHQLFQVVKAQSTTSSVTSSITSVGTSIISGIVVTTLDPGTLTNLPSGPEVSYISYNSTITLSSTAPSNSTAVLTSLTRNATVSETATTTASSERPSNTQPCNNFVELCNRKYSNITNVAAHNFAFAKKGNVASNQQYGPTDQLNDGIRMCKLLLEYHPCPDAKANQTYEQYKAKYAT